MDLRSAENEISFRSVLSIGLNIQFSCAAIVATILTVDYNQLKIPGVRKEKILVRSVSMVL